MSFFEIFNNQNQKEFVSNQNGLHTFGGELPPNFTVPDNQFLGGFQYLGKISKEDKFFNWLPFDLNLICPIFTDFEVLFLDYSKPLHPEIIYPNNPEMITSAFDEITIASTIVYEQQKFSLKDFEGMNEENEFEVFGVVGKPQPNFDDEPVTIPMCPKTNKKMKFVAQIFSNEHIKFKSKNFSSSNEYDENLFQTLNFWCDGSL